MMRLSKSSLILFIAALATLACTSGNKNIGEYTQNIGYLDSLIEQGRFAEAKQIVNAALLSENLSPEEKYLINFEADKMKRIKAEFNITEGEAHDYIKRYIPNVTQEQIQSWIASGALEAMKIDGELLFFKKAPHNLFLIDSTASEAYIAVEGRKEETSDYLEGYLPQILKESKSTPSGESLRTIQHDSYLHPERMRVTVRMRVFPNAAPKGETIRVWLPYIHAENPKYKDVKLLNVYRSDEATANNPNGDNTSNYLISPEKNIRQSIYLELKSNGTDTLKVGYSLEFTSFNQYFANLEEHIKPYDTTSEIFRRYTSERERHIIFTPKIKELTAQVVGSETNPYEIVKKIWNYIDKTTPWAGARDYSTISNIPMYVLQTGHGDCGEVSLLFITMARIAGIPAKWQSGWMLHPGHLNLHDWAEVYYEGVGWVPVDQSFGHNGTLDNPDQYYFFTRGLDAFRYIVNEDYGAMAQLYPAKIYPHFDEVDFQMGEVEWRGGNIYNGSDGWRCWMDIEYLK